MAHAMDLTGQQYHYLTALYRVENNHQGKPRWRCRCVCGREVNVSASDLKKKKYPTMSCGCMKRRLIGEGTRTHGMSKHPAWAVWHSMKQRCLSSNHQAYHNYGERGITVCPEWLQSFDNFWRDMGPTYLPGMDLDRIDNNQGYSPNNCRWVSRKETNRNKRSNRLINSPLGIMTVSELCEKTGIGETTMLYRLDHNWPPELLCAKPDVRNLCTTSKIVVRGTDSQYSIQSPVNSTL